MLVSGDTPCELQSLVITQKGVQHVYRGSNYICPKEDSNFE